MKTPLQLFALIVFITLVTACGGKYPKSKYPEEDRAVYELIEKSKKGELVKNELSTQYQKAVNNHLSKIEQYKTSGNVTDWEKIINAYARLNELADAINNSGQRITAQRFDIDYQQAKANAADAYIKEAEFLIQTEDRQNAKKAYNLLSKAKSWAPGNTQIPGLMKHAYEASAMIVLVNPVNYYAHSFGYWGLNTDYIQHEIASDLYNQVARGRNMKVLTDRDIRYSNFVPDRVIDLNWITLNIPMPEEKRFSRQVSKQIETGKTSDNKPIFTTVKATINITRVSSISNGTLEVRVTEPKTNRVIMWDNYPVSNEINEEYASYTGDSRALDASDLALMNRSAFRRPSRYQMFDNIYRQIYPQLISRLRSLNW